MDETQERLIARGLRDGRPEAWRGFYDAFAERVWRSVARSIGRCEADVADVVQETFFAAARSARNYDATQGSLWAWLCGIANNTVALHWRKRQQRERLKTSLNGRWRGWLDESDELPDDPLEAAELAECVRQTLIQLPLEYGALLAAKYLDDISVDQLARDERCTTAAIRSRLARARAAFREAFSQSEGSKADASPVPSP